MEEFVQRCQDDGSSTSYEENSSTEKVPTDCLFCISKFNNVEDAIEHCVEEHNFNIYVIRDELQLNNYRYIRLINFIRSNKITPTTDLTISNAWLDDDTYLKPVIDDDPWLWFDIWTVKKNVDRELQYVNSEDGTVTMTQEHFQEMQVTIQSLSDEIQLKNLQISKLNELMEQPISRTSCDLHTTEDSGYFRGYAAPYIHLEMLNDQVRTKAFQNALFENKSSISGKRVLDLGCGTAILSMFAVAAGAREVIGVDESDILYSAIDIIRENDMDKSITLIKGKIEQVTIHEPVDIIISEWMGYFLLFEGMLDSVVYARKKYLKPGGILLPSLCRLNFMAASYIERYNETIGAWDNVYGYDMSCMRSLAIREPSIELMPNEKLITSTICIHTIDTATCSSNDINFEQEFSLEVTKTGLLTHFVGSFDAEFNLPKPVSFTTGPAGVATHWKQTVFSLEKPVNVTSGERIQGTITCERPQKELRALEIHIRFNESTTTYYLN